MELFKIDFFPIRLLDILDVAIVSIVFYILFQRIKDTRAKQLIIGLLILIGASYIAAWAHLKALNTLISFFSGAWLVGIVVIFAPELRHFLMHLGQWRGLGLFDRPVEQQSVEEVVTAAKMLSEKQFGALMVIARENQLGSVIDTGTLINARVSYQLLATIFTPNSPLHDLSVVIRGNQLAAANCLLPLSDSRTLDRALGSRHRAAVGITEETDAIVVVISEETRQISIAIDGRLMANLSPSELRNNLYSLLR
ncbi:MAG: diadenylate cyclase CdaA [Candidatus Latescibacterota bacterium]